MNDVSNKISSDISKLEREKEQLIEEESVLRKKISDKKREISALKKRFKKAGKTEKKRQEENFEEKERNLPVSLRTLLFLPVISVAVVLSVIYANNLYPFADLGFLSAYYPLIIPFIISSITLVCFLASVFYFTLYQLILNYRKAKQEKLTTI